MTPQTFYNGVYTDARDIGCNHVQAAICAAQSAIETGWGEKVKGNSYFGIKARRSWKGEKVDFPTHEWVNGKKVPITDTFRAYLCACALVFDLDARELRQLQFGLYAPHAHNVQFLYTCLIP